MKACELNSTRLSAFVDGELHGWQAWRLRRHVARCPACARQREDWTRMNVALRAADIVPASPAPVALPLRSRKRSVFAQCLVGGTIVAAGVIGGIFYTTPSRTGAMNPAAARAEVDAAMAHVRNAQWRETSYADLEAIKKGKVFRSIAESSALLDPPIIIRREKIFESRKPDLTTIWRMDASEMEMYLKESDGSELQIFRKRKYRFDLTSPSISPKIQYKQMRNSVLGFMYVRLDAEQQGMPKSRFNHNGSLALVPIAPTLHHVMRNGRQMIEIREGVEYRGKVSPYTDNNTGWYRVIWADAFTHRIAAMEIYRVNLTTKRLLMRRYCDQYRYNQNLSADTFALHVPAGTSVSIDFKSVGVTH